MGVRADKYNNAIAGILEDHKAGMTLYKMSAKYGVTQTTIKSWISKSLGDVQEKVNAHEHKSNSREKELSTDNKHYIKTLRSIAEVNNDLISIKNSKELFTDNLVLLNALRNLSKANLELVNHLCIKQEV